MRSWIRKGDRLGGFFARVAPGLVKRAKEGEVKEIAKIVGQGGGFAGEIFRAMYAVCILLFVGIS